MQASDREYRRFTTSDVLGIAGGHPEASEELKAALERARREIRDCHAERATAPGLECGCEFCKEA